MDALTLSRAQFGFTIAFHYIFPPLSIGLGLCLVAFEGFYLSTGKKLYLEIARFYTRIFGLIFAMGVATGIVMEFQFGTNWSSYSRFVGEMCIRDSHYRAGHQRRRHDGNNNHPNRRDPLGLGQFFPRRQQIEFPGEGQQD